ncbi:MAG: response regulator transcription factor [Polaromonas sp.]|nr:response regulator transcription factor [Polaromonas sp.]
MQILLIDDHQLFSAGLRVLLEELSPGARVSTAASVEKALEQGQSKFVLYDLILLDLHLPDADGFGGLGRLKMAHEATPIVIVSSEENPARIRDCIHQGAMGFVPKSSNPTELFKAMTQILGGETYLPPSSVLPSSSDTQPKPGTMTLSPRQREVLIKVIQGKPNKIIARELGISDQTVKSHVMAVLAALGVSNRTEAVYKAASFGISASSC